MRRSVFRLGCLGSDWNTNKTVLFEAAQRAGQANGCSVQPFPLNGTKENGKNSVDAVLLMAKLGSQTLRSNTPVRPVDIDGESWEVAVTIVVKAMKELINEAAVLRLP